MYCLLFYFFLSTFSIFLPLFLPFCSSSHLFCSSFPPAPHWQLDYHVSMQCQKLAARQNHVLSHPWLLRCDEGQQHMTLGTREGKVVVTRNKRKRRFTYFFLKCIHTLCNYIHVLFYIYLCNHVKHVHLCIRIWFPSEKLMTQGQITEDRHLLSAHPVWAVCGRSQYVIVSTYMSVMSICASVWCLFEVYKWLLSQRPSWNCSTMRAILTALQAEYWIFQKVNKGLDH